MKYTTVAKRSLWSRHLTDLHYFLYYFFCFEQSDVTTLTLMCDIGGYMVYKKSQLHFTLGFLC